MIWSTNRIRSSAGARVSIIVCVDQASTTGYGTKYKSVGLGWIGLGIEQSINLNNIIGRGVGWGGVGGVWGGGITGVVM